MPPFTLKFVYIFLLIYFFINNTLKIKMIQIYHVATNFIEFCWIFFYVKMSQKMSRFQKTLSALGTLAWENFPMAHRWINRARLLRDNTSFARDRSNFPRDRGSLKLSLQLSEEKENSQATSVLLKSANFGLAQEEKTM